MNKKQSMSAIDALKRAIEIAGSQSALAKRINCSQQFISRCLKKRGATVNLAPKIERAVGRKVLRSELVPDFEW